jgi:membrane-associated HD superfamily phosphohydrolase
MLADGCEARARSELPKNIDEITILVNRIFDRCLQENQLEDTNLTLKDLSQIKESFIKTLNNTYHPRIQYPDQKISASANNEIETSIND